jgi:hypothetical protein
MRTRFYSRLEPTIFFTIILFLRFGMLPYFSVIGCSDRRFAAGSAQLFSARCRLNSSHLLVRGGFGRSTSVKPGPGGELAVRRQRADPRGRDLAVPKAPVAALAPPPSTA